jgi:hypothetical protein
MSGISTMPSAATSIGTRRATRRRA